MGIPRSGSPAGSPMDRDQGVPRVVSHVAPNWNISYRGIPHGGSLEGISWRLKPGWSHIWFPGGHVCGFSCTGSPGHSLLWGFLVGVSIDGVPEKESQLGGPPLVGPLRGSPGEATMVRSPGGDPFEVSNVGVPWKGSLGDPIKWVPSSGPLWGVRLRATSVEGWSPVAEWSPVGEGSSV
jgi:hypothetical protein